MGSGFSKMKKQARQLERMQEEMKHKTFEGTSSGNLVTLVVNGERELQSILIKPECVDPTDVEGLQDLIKEAFANACKQASSGEMDITQFFGQR